MMNQNVRATVDLNFTIDSNVTNWHPKKYRIPISNGLLTTSE